MEQGFEQDIPIPLIVACFVVLVLISKFVQKKLRDRNLRREGQVSSDAGRALTVEQRVASNPEWAKGEIQSKGQLAVIILWIVAAVWNLTFGVSFVKALSNPEMTTAARIILGVFASLGAVPIAFAVRFTLQQVRFGKSRCCIQGKAGVLGKIMQGRIFTKNDIPATGDYCIELQCLEFYQTGSGKNRKTQTKTHWQGKQTVPCAGTNARIGIPFSFDLPRYPPETGYQLARGKVNWQLTIKAPVKGVDFSALFIVPVFNMEQ